MTVFAPAAGAADTAVSAIKDTVGSYTDLRRAREENAELRGQVEQLNAELNQTRERAIELETLRTQLALPSRPEYRQVPANVISRNVSQWFGRLTIDRGSLDGVRRNLPVATATGIVGRVISVGPNFAQVQVITDVNAGVGVMLQSSRLPGELKGLGGPRCELRNVPASQQVQVGEAIVTTGLDRIYPKGLMVGTIEHLAEDPNATWHKIIIKPSAPVDRVEHVFVLLVESKDLKMDESIK
jgi:rod shape-determining protein MreC